MHHASPRFLVVLALFAVLAAHSQTPEQLASPQASQTKSARPKTKITSESLGPLTKHVSLPKVTEGVKRVLDLQNEHRRLALVAQDTPPVSYSSPPPYVSSVNDQLFSSTWIVPGAPYIFKGKGFGTTLGEVKLIGVFPGKPPRFRVDLWQDNVIYAYLDDNISGAYDQENVTLAVTAPGIIVTHSGVKFFASREVRELDLAPFFEPASIDPNDGNAFTARKTSKHKGLFRVEGIMEWDVGSNVIDPVNGTCRWKAPNFKFGGTDQFRLTALKPGWAAVGYEWYTGRAEVGETDYKGEKGIMATNQLSSAPATHDYEAEVGSKNLTVKWAVFNSLTIRPCFEMNYALASTFYEIKGYVEGPRGTDAF